MTPEVIPNPTATDVFAVITRAVFQAGVSWAQIAKHWDAYHAAFAGFDFAQVARFDDVDVDRIINTPGILKMPRKVKATIENARALQELLAEYGDFHLYVKSFTGYEAVARDIKKRFSFMGDMNAWYLLFRLGENVPRFEAWVQTIKGDHPRMREMVDLARATDRSAEVMP